jgi:DNA polymerase-3 subunit chi
LKRIDFHILKNSQEPYAYLARLVEKIYLLKNNLFILTGTAQESQRVDDLLWTFRDCSFLPHQIINDKTRAGQHVPILISDALVPRVTDVLINLSATVPNYYADFNRIVEVVCEMGSSQEQGRKKYRLYQSFGCQPQTFHIN